MIIKKLFLLILDSFVLFMGIKFVYLEIIMDFNFIYINENYYLRGCVVFYDVWGV